MCPQVPPPFGQNKGARSPVPPTLLLLPFPYFGLSVTNSSLWSVYNRSYGLSATNSSLWSVCNDISLWMYPLWSPHNVVLSLIKRQDRSLDRIVRNITLFWQQLNISINILNCTLVKSYHKNFQFTDYSCMRNIRFR